MPDSASVVAKVAPVVPLKSSGRMARPQKFYEKAVKAADNNMTAPMYLRKAGLAEQAQGNKAAAAAYYERILTSYPASMEARDAEKLLGSVK